MKKISDNTLVGLFIVALIVTIAGTTISMEKYLGVDFGNFLTGAATDTSAVGEVNITINSVTSLTNQVSAISFGSGRVNASCDYCVIDTNFINTSYFSDGTKLSSPLPFHGGEGQGCCVGFSGNQSGFLIENTGNVNISVGYQCSRNCTFDSFLGGTRQAAMAGLEIKVTPNLWAQQSGESGGLDTLASCAGNSAGGGLNPGGLLPFNLSGWNISNATGWGIGNGARSQAGFNGSTYVMLGGVHYQSPNNVSSGGHWLCGNQTHYPLSSNNNFDAAVVDINLTIPSDAPATGVRSSLLITFNGTSV